MRHGWCDINTKQHSLTEVRIIPNKEKKCKKSRSSLKTVLIILFNYWGMVHYECIPRGQKVTQELSVTVLQHLQEALQRHDWNFRRNTASLFTVTILPCTWWCPCRSFLQKTKFQWFHSHPAVLISFQQTFLVPKLDSQFKRASFGISTGNTRKVARTVSPNFFKIVYGMLETMETSL